MRVGFCVIVLCLVIAAPARAAVIAVTTTADAAGACSLREAIAAANTNTAQGACPPGQASADVISLPPGVYELATGALAVTGAGGQLAISSTSGPAATSITLDGIAARLLDVAAGESVTVTGVTFTGGRADGAGGAIRNAGTLTLIDSVVTSSQAGPGAGGGGIFSSGALSLLRTTVTGNAAGAGAPGSPGAAGGSGGGIATDGSLSIVSSRILGNRAGAGGAGVAGQNGGAGGSGGGVFVAASGSATVLDALFAANAAGSGGSGAIGGNGGRGGGIDALGPADVRFSTLMTGATGTGGPGSPPGSNGLGTAITNQFAPASTVRSTILSGSCMGGFTPATTANLGSATAGCPGSGAAPRLSAAGVPTVGSPAIDGAPLAGCPATDLAGVRRPQGVACDIGAFEVAAGTLAYSRTSLAFPAVRRGSASTLGVTVRNTGPAGLALPVSISGAGFRIASRTCASVLTGARSCGVSVAFAPTGAGPFSGSLRLGPRTLPLSGTGLAAPIPATAKKCRVPRLKGKTVKQARRALKKRHCRLGKVTRRGRGRPGRVRASRPKAGSVRAAGTRVRVFVNRRR